MATVAIICGCAVLIAILVSSVGSGAASLGAVVAKGKSIHTHTPLLDLAN